MSKNQISRRLFLATTAAISVAGCATGTTKKTATSKKSAEGLPVGILSCKSPNEKLNIAAIGAGGKGSSDIDGCSSENIIALCDPDWKTAGGTFDRYPNAKRYKDFRVLLDKETTLDAVTVSTPDHMHAFAAIDAMERGKHVYVQKPMAHTVYEARKMAEIARKYKVATQMGNQGHTGEGVRKFCELIWSGVIGNVREVHAWTNRPIWPQGIDKPLPAQEIPETMAWDVWLGPAPARAYNKGYAPFNWRGWFDFGCGALGDMACHILDPSNWALQLKDPISIECVSQEKKNSETFPTKSIIRYEFPQRGSMPPVTLYWYDGGNLPPRPKGVDPKVRLGDGDNGSLFIGEKGMIHIKTYGDDPQILPAELAKDLKTPLKMIPRSAQNRDTDRDHKLNWIYAIKGGTPACSNFDYAGPFTEWVVLGNLALRCEGKLLWDAAKMKVTNNPAANQYVNVKYRKGWHL